MSEPGDLFAAVAADFSARVHGTSDWSAESPCEGWSARDLVVHVITMFRSVKAWANGVDRVEVTPDEDVVVAWDAANADLKAVLAVPAICAAVFPTPFGPMPVDQMIDQLICLEILAHTWDLSRATGQDDTLNADAVEWVHNAVKTLDAVLRDPGIMGSKIESPAGADAQTQFLNFVGRAV